VNQWRSRFLHVVPWYVRLLPFHYQIAWIWLAWMRSPDGFAVYPGDLLNYFKWAKLAERSQSDASENHG
jgi:hypothetical protein